MPSDPARTRHRWFAAFYAHFADKAGSKRMEPLRRFAAGSAAGRVLEPGAGTGSNLPFYDWGKVETLDLTEPDPYMRRYLQPHIDALPPDVRARVRLHDAPAESLPFDDSAFDCAVVTLVLCTVADPHQSLAELHRVLAPGGQLRLVEHIAAEGLAGGLQRLVQPVYGWTAGGCQLHRDTERLLAEAGFDLDLEGRTSLGGPLFPSFSGTAHLRWSAPRELHPWSVTA